MTTEVAKGQAYTQQSAFYNVNNALINGQLIQNIFSTRNPSYHGKYIRPIHKLYSMSTLLAFEPLVDKTVNTLLRRLGEEFVDERNVGTPCDIGDWLLYCKIVRRAFG